MEISMCFVSLYGRMIKYIEYQFVTALLTQISWNVCQNNINRTDKEILGDLKNGKQIRTHMVWQR